MNVKKIMVIGSGQIGRGVTQVLAQSGYQVVLNHVRKDSLVAGFERIVKGLEKDVVKGKKTEIEKNNILQNIVLSTSLEDAKDCQIVIESVVEQIEVKKEIFKKLDEVCGSSTILATTTSSLPITELASVTKFPQNVIGMHFINPVSVMKLVEVIRGVETSDETYKTIKDISVEIGKIPVEVNDGPGFVSTRILMCMINEAMFCLYESLITEPEAIDTVARLGYNHPIGPLKLADFIGLDTCLNIMEVLYNGFKDTKYMACPLLVKYVKAGRLGVKTGRGFYVYE